MFERLYKLIFGLDEFSKTQIELRFELAEEITDKLEVSSINDFDYLESCIYKIKDQLRVKSSNLNNIINNSNKPLTKQRVEEFLTNLQTIRQHFLNSAFNAIEQVAPQKKDSTFTYNNSTISLKTKGGFHIEITSNNIDLQLVKKLTTVITELLQNPNVSIIIDKTIAKIIPRIENDNRITPLPANSMDLDDVYAALTNEYKTIKEASKQPIKTKYHEEESLDQLVAAHEAETIPHNSTNSQNINFAKDEEIEVEKQTNNDSLEPETTPSTIYEDEKIKAYISQEEPIFGVIIIQSKTNIPIKQLKENDFAYLLLFTKAFASILFESIQAHGTSILWENDKDFVKIVPRYQEDKTLKEWKTLELQDDTLTKLKDELHTTLAKESSSHKQEPQPKQETIPEKTQEVEENPKMNTSKKKAETLLRELRKIP